MRWNPDGTNFQLQPELDVDGERRLAPLGHYITPNLPTVGKRSVSITLGAIPRVYDQHGGAVRNAGERGDGVRLSTVDFNGSGNVTFSGSLNVKPYISAFER